METDGPGEAALDSLASPAGPGSGEPNLAVGEDGRIHLTWLEPAAGGHALRHAALSDGSWSSRVTVVERDDLFVNWADFPSVLPLAGNRLAVHWLQRSGEGPYAYDLLVATSDDGGRTWSAPAPPHTDGTPTEHGFATLFPLERGSRLGVVWLDGRAFHAPSGGTASADMSLRFAALSPDDPRERAEEALLDPRTCDCCQTTVTETPDGLVVFYRDRSDDEIRDIAAVHRTAEGWSEPRLVHGDGWRLDACPVNGPAADAAGHEVAVAWFTAADGEPMVRVAFSADGGRSFPGVQRVDDGNPEGRVDLVHLDDGGAAVVWLERVAGRAEVRARRVTSAGRRGESVTIAASDAARASGFPRVVTDGAHLTFAWTAVGAAGDETRVRLAQLPLESLP